MITVQTNKLMPILNDRFKLIGNYRLYLTIQYLEMDPNNVIASGYYYYINDNNEVVKLKDTRTTMQWSTVMYVEENMLNPITATTLKESVLQRMMDFTLIKLTEESGENFGTVISDWL